jgi:hypothetical protein
MTNYMLAQVAKLFYYSLGVQSVRCVMNGLLALLTCVTAQGKGRPVSLKKLVAYFLQQVCHALCLSFSCECIGRRASAINFDVWSEPQQVCANVKLGQATALSCPNQLCCTRRAIAGVDVFSVPRGLSRVRYVLCIALPAHSLMC